MADKQHPLHGNYVFLKSGKRLALIEQYTDRSKKSLIPKCVKLFKNNILKEKNMNDAWIVCK